MQLYSKASAGKSRDSVARRGGEMGRDGVPSIAHLSFRGGAPVLWPPLTHDIIVIDDFWHDAPALRRHALGGRFVYRVSESGFAFHDFLADARHTERFAELVARVGGASLLSAHFEGRFVYETDADEAETRRKVWVHYDRWRRVGVLYLSDPVVSRGGTGFYRHIETGLSRVEDADALGKRPLLMEDSTRLDRWELIHQVPIRFNRMVLFSPGIFHQAICYFGRSREDARLYNIVAFDVPPPLTGKHR